MADEEKSDLVGQTVKVEFGGHEVTSTVCEHGLPAIECPHCDIFGEGYSVEDNSSWKDRVADPIGWLRIRWWILRHNWRNRKW